MEDIQALLEKKGVRPSLHRMKILDYLVTLRNHPTADMIYNDISPDIPTLSKTTVYNTLKLFAECGVVQAITIEDNEVRYDATMEIHAHFKCTLCGGIHDIPVREGVLSIKSAQGHKIIESQLNCKGICRDCLKK
jgi:Fur family transcriptional regulator, peroxide stress response regulator